MIKTWKHRGLRDFFERGATRRIDARHAERYRQILTHLNAAGNVRDMDLPGYAFHELAPRRRGDYAVRAHGPWRVTFQFREGNAYNVDLEQYHDRLGGN